MAGRRKKRKPPIIRFPKSIKKGEIINVRVQAKYPSITGLSTIGDTDEFMRKEPAVYLSEMKVTFGGKEVCTFIMSSAVSEDPRIEFPLKVENSGTLTVRFETNKGEVFESTEEIKV
jgi:hypothetical protein